MGKQDTPWQSKGLTPLERKLQSERDKKMGIFRKKKPEPKKKVRVEEFKFDKGFGMPDFDIKPGQIIQWGRRTGENPFYEFHKLLQERGLPMPDFDESPWQRGRNTRLEDSQYQFAIEMLGKKHRVQIEVEQGFGDYVIFCARGRRMDTIFKLSRTQIATVKDTEQLIGIIERGLNLNSDELPGDKITKKIIGEPKTPTDEWAEKWAKENS